MTLTKTGKLDINSSLARVLCVKAAAAAVADPRAAFFASKKVTFAYANCVRVPKQRVQLSCKCNCKCVTKSNLMNSQCLDAYKISTSAPLIEAKS